MAYKKRGRSPGRPKIMAASTPINIRLRQDQYVWLESAALMHGVSKSDVMRLLFEKVMRVDRDTNGQLARELMQ